SAGWTLVSIGQSGNGLVAEMQAGVPAKSAASAPNSPWIQLQADLTKFPIAKKWGDSFETNLPRILFVASGEAKQVTSHDDLVFGSPLEVELPEWRIPTNLVHDPLIGFSAIRGFRPWLQASKRWD